MCEEASWVRECARLQSGRRGVQVSEQCLTLGQAAMQADFPPIPMSERISMTQILR